MSESGYGLWPLVVINTVLVAVFAASFFHPRTGRDWRAMGAFTGFLVALFTEMYGAPLTVYLLIMTGFLVEWPTIPTLAMFPVLVIIYIRLARNEEREVAARLGATWSAYAARTPRFLPAALRHPLTTISRSRGRTEP